MSTRPKYASDLADKTLVRFPPGMKGQLEEAARENNRSLSAEIVWRLGLSLPSEAAFEDDESDKLYFYGQQLKGIHDRIAQLNRVAERVRSTIIEELETRRPNKP